MKKTILLCGLLATLLQGCAKYDPLIDTAGKSSSNFDTNQAKEISKQFKRIFHKDMTLGGLQDLQEEVNLINPVDSYLENQVTKLEKANANKKSVQGSRTIRQTNSKGERFVETTVQAEAEEEKVSF